MAKPNALGLVGKRQVILGSAILGIVLAAVIAIVCVFSVEGVSLTGEEPSSQIKGGSTIRTTTSTTSDRGSGKRGHDHDNQPGAGYQPDDNHLSYWYHRANARYGG